MSRYRKISVRIWGDEKFLGLSKPQPNGQTLWLYLLTGPHTTALPGAFCIGEAALAEALNWPLKAFRKAFQEVFDKGMVQADWQSRLVFIPKAISHNPPESPNVVKAWKSYFEELPDCALKAILFAHYETVLTGSYREAFGKAFPEGYRYDKTEGLPKDYGESGTGTGTGTGTGENPKAPLGRSLGRYGWARLTDEEHANVIATCGVHADALIAEFDCWVQQAPEAKAHGVKRRDRHPEATILAWFRRKTAEGRYGNTKATAAAANTRAAQDFVGRKLAETVRLDFPDVRQDS